MDRIKEINKKLSEIEKLQQPLWDEQFALEKETDGIYNMLAIELIKTVKWSLKYKAKDYLDIMLCCGDYEEEKQLDKELWKLGGDYHATFNLVDGVSLYQSDGEVYIIFEDIKVYRKYVEEWKLQIDYSSFLEKLSEFKESIKVLEDMMLGK